MFRVRSAAIGRIDWRGLRLSVSYSHRSTPAPWGQWQVYRHGIANDHRALAGDMLGHRLRGNRGQCNPLVFRHNAWPNRLQHHQLIIPTLTLGLIPSYIRVRYWPQWCGINRWLNRLPGEIINPRISLIHSPSAQAFNPQYRYRLALAWHWCILRLFAQSSIVTIMPQMWRECNNNLQPIRCTAIARSRASLMIPDFPLMYPSLTDLLTLTPPCPPGVGVGLSVHLLERDSWEKQAPDTCSPPNGAHRGCKVSKSLGEGYMTGKFEAMREIESIVTFRDQRALAIGRDMAHIRVVANTASMHNR